MMNGDGMDQLVNSLIARGYTRAKAERYAALIGDTIEIEDGTGLWIIRAENGAVIDRIEPLPD